MQYHMSRDMTNKQRDCAPSEDSDQPDAQADLSLRSAHSHFR